MGKNKRNRKTKKRRKPKNKAVKEQLFLKCGTVDMYDMQVYDKRKLTLHHDPPFRYTHHTVFEESYLLTRKNHDYVERLSNNNHEEYVKVMKRIKENKRRLINDKNKL